MPQANPEDRNARVHELLHLTDNPSQGSRIAWAIAEEHTRWLVGQHLFSRGSGRNHADTETALPQTPQDVVLDAEIVSHDGDVGGAQRQPHLAGFGRRMLLRHREVRRVLILFVPDETLRMGDFDDVIPALHRTPLTGPSHRVRVGHRFCGQEPGQGTPHPELLGQRPGVDPLDSWNAILIQIRGQRQVCSPVAHHRTEFPNDEPGTMGLPGLHVLKVDARIANHRVGHRHDLTLVGRIGEDLLIAGH